MSRSGTDFFPGGLKSGGKAIDTRVGATNSIPKVRPDKRPSQGNSSWWKDVLVGASEIQQVEAALPDRRLHSLNSSVLLSDSTFGGGFSFADVTVMASRAADAIRLHRGEIAYQDNHPSEDWIITCCKLYANLARWINLMDIPQDRRFETLEIWMRGHHPFSASPSLDPTVLHHSFDKVEVKQKLLDTMKHGVELGIPRPLSSVRSKPSKAAELCEAKALDKLFDYVAKGICHVFFLDDVDLLSPWGFYEVPAHFVIDQGRLVVNMAAQQDDGTGLRSANDISEASSATSDLEDPLCDMLDSFLPHIVEMLRAANVSEQEVVALKADIRRAHVQTPIRPEDIGLISLRLGKYFFVFRRTPFGWKYSAHTWTPFAAALKQQLTTGTQDLSKSMCKEDLFFNDAEAVLKESRLLTAFCDDFMILGSNSDDQRRRSMEELNAKGMLLLGKHGFNEEKAAEEGFWSYVQRYTGILFDLKHGTASFDPERYLKLIDLLDDILDLDPVSDHVPLHLPQRICGVTNWMVQVIHHWRSMTAGFRRCLVGVSSAADKDTPTSPARVNESHAISMQKLQHDAASLLEECRYTLLHPEAGVIPLRRLLSDSQRVRDWSCGDIIFFASDACDTGLAVLNITKHTMVVIPLGPALQRALRRTRNEHGEMDDEEVAALIKVTIALPEFICILVIIIQYDRDLREAAIEILRWFCDNENAVLWAQKGFAGNPIAQQICRLLGVLEHLLGFRTRSIYISTLANLTSDLSSRIFDCDGNVVKAYGEELLQRNQELQHPYQLEYPCQGVCELMVWLEGTSHVYGDLQDPPPLERLLDLPRSSDPPVKLSLESLQASAQVMRDFASDRRTQSAGPQGPAVASTSEQGSFKAGSPFFHGGSHLLPGAWSLHADVDTPGSLAHWRSPLSWHKRKSFSMTLNTTVLRWERSVVVRVWALLRVSKLDGWPTLPSSRSGVVRRIARHAV